MVRPTCSGLRLAKGARSNYRSFTTSIYASSSSLPSPRPDYSIILNSTEEASSHLNNRKSPLSLPIPQFIEKIHAFHKEIQELLPEVTRLRAERNAFGKVLASKTATLEEKNQAKAQAQRVREVLFGSKGDSGTQEGLEVLLETKEGELLDLTLQVPNASSIDAPVGGYDAIEVVKFASPNGQAEKVNEIEVPASDHVTLLQRLGWLSLPTHVTGSSWPYLLKGGALLEQALIQYALSKALEAGYEMVIPPDVVKHEVMKRCGFHPRDSGGEAQTYFVSTSQSQGEGEAEADLALAATSEIPMAGFLANTLYKHPDKELPRKYVAVGHAFRAEAGARGKESKGLYRVHQFSKVELFAVTSGLDGQASDLALQDMVELQWSILKGLGLPLRLLNMPTAELGGSAYQKYDIEAWMPGKGAWGELASASNCTDYQARRLGIRHSLPTLDESADTQIVEHKSKSKTTFAHTLNATAAAVPRLIVAIIENGARFDKDGTWIALELPSVLQKYWLGSTGTHQVVAQDDSAAKKNKQSSTQPTTVEIRWKA